MFVLTLARSIDRLHVMKTYIGFTLFFCAFLAIWPGPSAAGEKETSPFEGVILRSLTGEKVAMDSLLDEGPLVINFWATWCSPCRLEMPHLEKVYREFAPKGVQFAVISVDRKGHMDRVKTFLEKQKVSIPAYIDHDTALAKSFKVRAIPTTMIILEDRSLYHRNKGYSSGDEVMLRKHLQAMLEREAAAGDEEAADGADESAAEGADDGPAEPGGGTGTAPGTEAVVEPAETGD